MSTFSVPIKRIRAIEPHPNADAIELAVVDGYRSIVKKGEFAAGDLIAYLPESAILPEWLLRRAGFWDETKGIGRLNGKQGNRIKAIRLRGELSQGICLPTIVASGKGQDPHNGHDVLFRHLEGNPAETGAKLVVSEGDDVSGWLGIVKYEPPVPVAMAGEVFNAGSHLTLDFDVENWKSFPEVLQPGEEVVFTEKLHGTFTGVAILPYEHAHQEAFGEKRNILIFSKGLGAKGLVFKNNERNANNLYARATRDLITRIDALQRENDQGVTVPNFILGETYGPGVQDLAYGKAIGFRVFAVAYGYRDQLTFQNWSSVTGSLKEAFGFETVPELYCGPFSEAVMREHTDGVTTLDAEHLREGIVMVPLQERRDPNIGRVCLKSVSGDYLTRKGGTEFN